MSISWLQIFERSSQTLAAAQFDPSNKFAESTANLNRILWTMYLSPPARPPIEFGLMVLSLSGTKTY